MKASEPTTLELLAPARDLDTAIAAIMHGADAVYIGGPAFGARNAAANSIEEIRQVVEAARPFGVRVYVTLNTIIYDDELAQAEAIACELADAGVTALIVQDMALLSMNLPPTLELHASTQCDARTPEKVAMLAKAGFSQIVLPREFSLKQIKAAAQAAPEAAMEVFVHGALCVSYSGDCQAGFVTTGRSANRGCCPQICRLEFRLTDSEGRTVAPPDGGRAVRHWLSLADMNRLDALEELAKAGARSFKIEGRLKNPAYVKQVTAAYSAELDRIVARSGGRYRRASYGRTDISFKPDLAACFNRGFTRYFLTESDTKVSSTLTPKWTGPSVGKFVGKKGAGLRIQSACELHAGDGLGWFDAEGRFNGFRVNRVDGDIIFPAPQSNVPREVGTQLYRNSDSALDAAMVRTDTGRRKIAVSMQLLRDGQGHSILRITDERGMKAEVCTEEIFDQPAKTHQAAYRRDQMERLGDTVYRLENYDDNIPGVFIPAKVLSTMRRKAVEELDRAWTESQPKYSRSESRLAPDALAGVTLTYHDNVANVLSGEFYRSHGAETGAKALECSTVARDEEVLVMTTRYCIRREQGACLRKPGQANLMPRGDLRLEAPVGTFRVHCDCPNCQMKIYRIPIKKP